MARVDDKARYFLERAVPQLREFESKEIFTKDEIRSIVSKRTEFERIVLSPGCRPEDYLVYIAWDQSLDNLRAKRCHRLKIKQSTGHTSQGRIFQTFERAVKRHPGSTLLWRRYLEYAAQCKATKRWRRIMTNALRMLPNDSELWVMAGRRAAQDGDMEGARSFFMRGCRFCTTAPLVWTEYARLELDWLVRLSKKKGTPLYNTSVAALTATGAVGRAGNVYEEGEGMAFHSGDEDEDEDDAGDSGDFADSLGIALTETGVGAKQPAGGTAVLSDNAMRRLAATPALEGAIPRAIFDAAVRQPFFDAEAAEAFFDVIASVDAAAVPSQPALLAHVLATIDARFPDAPATCNVRVKRPLLGLRPDDPAFPPALRAALATVWKAMGTTFADAGAARARFAAKSNAWIDALLAHKEDLDKGLEAVLRDARRKLERAAAEGKKT